MTRINVGIPPADLVNQHLIAEHREINVYQIVLLKVNTIWKVYLINLS